MAIIIDICADVEIEFFSHFFRIVDSNDAVDWTITFNVRQNQN